ncbi:MAG: polysaccharide deacetylase, partial [Micavibrio aeruginosavorus]
SELLAKQKRGETLSPNTIALTFDEPDEETYTKAIPLLVQNKIPFTLFISPGLAEQSEWETLKNLRKSDFVTIGLSTFTYGHLGGWSEENITEDLNRAKAIYREKLEQEPDYFAYPLGEYSAQFVSAVQKAGFHAAFGQNSGVMTQATDVMKIPRFTMTDDFGDLDRFRTTSNAMPFPVKDLTPDTSYMMTMPDIGFTIDNRISDNDIKKTKCFSSGTIQPETVFLGTGRIELRFPEAPITDRLRINCTITVAGELPDDDPRYRWLGFLLYFPVKTEAVDFSPEQP